MLTKKQNLGLDRRTFLRRSGLVAGSLAALGIGQVGSIRKLKAGEPPPAGATVSLSKNICTHCSVGCSVTGEGTNCVWTGQEAAYDSPVNLGSHCCQGMALRDYSTGSRRLRHPFIID